MLVDGTFQRAGVDLHLHGRAGEHLVLSGYFASEHPAALVAPNGERLNADAIALLAGQHAEAQPSSANDASHHAGPFAIGHVDKIAGDVTVQRNGVTVTLHVGDTIYRNDVIQTGNGASVAISLSDGTALHLVANTRMVLNEYSFNADSSSNHALFTVPEGTFVFVAGKVAHDGGMKIATPVGIMAVHEGTTGWAHELSAKEIATISAKLGHVTYSFAVVNTADSHGLYDLLVGGAVVGNIGDPNLIWYLDQDGNLISMPLDHSQEFADGLPRDFLAWLDEDIATRSVGGIHGSGGPIDPSTFPQAINLNQLGPAFDFNAGPNGSTFSVTLPSPNDQPVFTFHSSPSIKVPSGPFIWNGFGNWDLNPLNWDAGFAPTNSGDDVIIRTGKSSYTANYSVASLAVDFGAILNIAAGSLTVGGLTNAGLIEINSSGVDPALIIDGPITLTGGGTIAMLGPTTGNFILGALTTGATLINADNLIEGSGNIGAGDGNLTFINEAIVDATPVHAGDSGLLLLNTGNAVQNFGVFEATLTGTLLVQDRLFNFGTVEAVGVGSQVVIDNSTSGNAGLIEAILGGTLTIENSTIINTGTDSQGRTIAGSVFAGAGSTILLDNATILEGFVSVESRGLIETVSGTTNRIDTSNGPTRNTTQPTIVNDGKVLINDNSALILASPFDIINAGTIELASTVDRTLLEFNQPFAILSGGGDVILDGGQSISSGDDDAPNGFTPSQDTIDGLPGVGFATAHLENRDNTISGAGFVGQGNGALAFQNDALGTVDADLFGQTLEITTGGNAVFNAGLFEATGGAELKIESTLDNSGKVVAHSFSDVLIEADVTNENGGRIVAHGAGAVVDIVGRPCNDVSLDNFGRIAARQSGSVLLEFTDVTNEDTGRIVAEDRFSQVEIGNSQVDNDGVVVARGHGDINFYYDRVTNEHDGLIKAVEQDSKVTFAASYIDNSGEIVAEHHGEVIVALSHLDNDRRGVIEADGSASDVVFGDDHVDNPAPIEGEHHGKVEFDVSHVDNDRRGIIEAEGRGSEVAFDRDEVVNWGWIGASRGGEVEFDRSWIENGFTGGIEANGNGSVVGFNRSHIDNWGWIGATGGGLVEFNGQIEADGRGSEVGFDHDRIDNSGQIEADHGGEVRFHKAHVHNHRPGEIVADGKRSEIDFRRSHVDNSGVIDARKGGEVEFDRSHVDNDGAISALSGGTVDFDHGHIDNDSGTIAASGTGSTVNFHDTYVTGGILSNLRGGLIEVVQDTSTFNDLTIAFGSEVDVDKHATLDLTGSIDNFGTISVALHGELDLLSATVDGGGSGLIRNLNVVDVFDADTLRNLSVAGGEMDVESGATLHVESTVHLDGVDVENDGGTIIVDVPRIATKLVIEDGTAIAGGQLTLNGAGTLDVEHGGNASGAYGAALHRLAVTDDGSIDIGAAVTDAVLTLDDGTAISGSGTLTIETGSTLDVEKGTGTGILGATLDGLNVTDNGAMDVGDNAIGAVLTLDDGTTITGGGAGTLTIKLGSTLDVEAGTTGPGATLDGVGVTDNGAFDIGDGAAGALLTFDDGTTVSGTGALTINSGSTLDIEHGSGAGPNYGATFDGISVIVANNGALDVGDVAAVYDPDNPDADFVPGATLTLEDGTFISGSGALTVQYLSTLDVEKGTGAGNHGATFDGLYVNAFGSLDVGDVAAGAVLTLEDGTTINGSGGEILVKAGSTLDIENGTTGPGATFKDISINNVGETDIGAGATLTLDNMHLTGGGAVSMKSGSAITDDGSFAIFDNYDNVISGQGTIGGDELRVINQNVIDADVAGQALIISTSHILFNLGSLEATDGATLDIKGDVTNVNAFYHPAYGRIEAHGDGSTVKLEAVTVTNGVIAIDAGNTLAIDGGTTHLVHVDVENAGTLKIDLPRLTTKLELDAGTSLDGHVIINGAGELDVNDATFGDITIDDSGILNINGPLSLNGSFTINVLAGGSFSDTAPLVIADSKQATLSGASFGEVDIGSRATLTLDNADATVVDFKGADGTLVLDTPSSFTGTIKDLHAGDVIDLAGVQATSVALDAGNHLVVNGGAIPFTVTGGLPAGDVFLLRDDGLGGTDIKVSAPLVTLATQAISGTEGSPIPISFSDTLQDGASLTSVTISGIPAGASLSDDLGTTLAINNGSITLSADQLAGLKITPANAADFTLSLAATATDSDRYQYSVPATEAVTVGPLAPAASFGSGSATGTEGSPVAIALSALAKSLPGDATPNTLVSVVLTGIPDGATLSDGSAQHSATVTGGSLDITDWTLANLTITPVSTAPFTITATVTEKDGDTPAQTSIATATESVTIGPLAPTASFTQSSVSGTEGSPIIAPDNVPLPVVATTGLEFAHADATFWTNVSGLGNDWQTGANWNGGIPSSLLNAVIDSSVTHASNAYVIAVAANDTSEAYALTLNDAEAKLLDHGSLTVDSTLIIHGGTLEVAGGTKFDVGNTIGTSPGGVLTVAGNIAVDGGKLIVDAGSDSSTNDPSNLHPVPGGALNAASINVETGGTVELHGTVHVTGLVETTGGNLIVGSDAHFTGTQTLTFGSDGGTVTFSGSAGQTYAAPDIAGFGTGGAHPDVVDLTGFDPAKTVLSESSSNGNLVLTATDGGTATTLTFDHFNGALSFASDGSGGMAITGAAVANIAANGTVDMSVTEAGGVQGTVSASDAGVSGAITTSITPEGTGYLGHFAIQPTTSAGGAASVAFSFSLDQASVAANQTATQSYDIAVSEGSSTVLHQTVSVSMGGAGADNFAFAPGVGADTIVNFDAAHDTIDLSQFQNIQSVQQLAAMTTTDAHGDAVVDLGNHDSITIAGINAAQFQQMMQTAVHLH